ncbi:helix-turn-helix domain-containing protein [Aromatoleum bremense]|uniref:Helix-turn-helix domain-containing protein n=1 Tax=Aromatoleum bremense TaxID=76115 RepID=A0ABX1NXT1_9RHOO|nr:helix-turn-helix domain-containing protein [Aromatoleum bremense]QTQ31619.1 Uncharacterized protein pbN1_16280 [Aromatoleum bremense]
MLWRALNSRRGEWELRLDRIYWPPQKGEIPALKFKLGGTWRFRRSDLDRWLVESIDRKEPEAE